MAFIPSSGGGAPVAQQAAQTGILQDALAMAGNIAGAVINSAKNTWAMITSAVAGHGFSLGAIIPTVGPLIAAVGTTWLVIKGLCGLKKAIENHHNAKVGRNAQMAAENPNYGVQGEQPHPGFSGSQQQMDQGVQVG